MQKALTVLVAFMIFVVVIRITARIIFGKLPSDVHYVQSDGQVISILPSQDIFVFALPLIFLIWSAHSYPSLSWLDMLGESIATLGWGFWGALWIVKKPFHVFGIYQRRSIFIAGLLIMVVGGLVVGRSLWLS